MTSAGVELREMRPDDLAVFFEHQRDPRARHMAAFTSGDPEDRDAFFGKWNRILDDDDVGQIPCLEAAELVGQSQHGSGIDGDHLDQLLVGESPTIALGPSLGKGELIEQVLTAAHRPIRA